MRLRSLLAAAVLLGTACSADTTSLSDLKLVVRTDKPVYSLAADAAARPVLLNVGSVVVYAPMNEYVYVERLVAGRWQDRRAWFSVDGIGVSFGIQPGDSLSGIPMTFGYVDDRPGTYRFVFEVALDPHGRRLVHESERVSAPFELRP